MKKPRPLITRLRAARIVLRQERAVIFDSERNPDGSVADDVARLLARFDEAGQACAEAALLVQNLADLRRLQEHSAKAKKEAPDVLRF